MNREQAVRTLRDRGRPWDIIVIGGGAAGLGAAVDAASRGYAVLVLEQHDFAKGTSSRSTKLIHGGVRYLAQGRVSLVRSALHERELLLRNAPHLVHDVPFVIPAYSLWELPFYFAGITAYDLLAGGLRRGRSRWLSRHETLEKVPTLQPAGLRGGILYHDCQFDDARLAMALARTATDLGGTAVNYMRVEGFSKRDGRIQGVLSRDLESNEAFEIPGRVVINATGVFADWVLRMDEPERRSLIVPSRGIHLVLERRFLPGTSAVVVPHTEDGRILFAIPWHGKVLVGTTDVPVEMPTLEPCASASEIEFLLRHAGRFLTVAPTPADVRSVFAGLRPLIAARNVRRTAALSRDHHLEVSPAGLVTIAGGKWTTYRLMGEQAVDRAARAGELPPRSSRTRDVRLHGSQVEQDADSTLSVYGSDAAAIRQLSGSEASLAETIHPRLPYLKAEVIWAARCEMARTVEDVLARRLRGLFLDARASIEAAPLVATLLAAELGRTPEWAQRQVSEFSKVAGGYLGVPGSSPTAR